MSGFLRRWRRRPQQEDRAPKPAAEPLSGERIIAGYRMNWMRTAMGWDAERRATIAARVSAVIRSTAFERNALERRFRVEGLDDQAHSGASLIALADVLRGLDKFERNDDNQP